MGEKIRKSVMFIANRLWLTLAIYIISILIAGILFDIAEAKSLKEGIWWAFVTALTIGYGDYAPTTDGGRLVGIFFGHFWIYFIAPMIIANIVVRMLVDRDKFTNAEQEWLFKSIEKIAERDGVKLDTEPPDY